MVIGTTAVNVGGTHINIGTIVSPNSSIVVGYSSPNITIDTNSSIIRSWSDKGTSFAASSGNGYFVTATSTATLPASPAQGDTIIFMNAGAGASGIVITANTGQTIVQGTQSSTTAGTCTSQADGDSITLVYQTASTTWYSYGSQGTWLLA